MSAQLATEAPLDAPSSAPLTPFTARSSLGPHVVLAVFTLLVIGGIALALFVTSPPDAVQQLRAAAGATSGTSSFVLTDTNAISPLTSGPTGASVGQSMVVHVRFSAPDAVEETGTLSNGQVATLIVVGSRRFERQAGAKRFTEGPPAPGLGEQAAQTLLLPVQDAAHATDAVRIPAPAGAQAYVFLPDHEETLVRTVLGATSSQVTGLAFSALVRGEFLVDERITGVLQGQRLSVDLAFSQVGSAAPVKVPATS